MSRTGSRTALIWTRLLSVPSAGAFPHLVQLKEGKLLFLNRILKVQKAILYSILRQTARVV